MPKDRNCFDGAVELVKPSEYHICARAIDRFSLNWLIACFSMPQDLLYILDLPVHAGISYPRVIAAIRILASTAGKEPEFLQVLRRLMHLEPEIDRR